MNLSRAPSPERLVVGVLHAQSRPPLFPLAQENKPISRCLAALTLAQQHESLRGLHGILHCLQPSLSHPIWPTPAIFSAFHRCAATFCTASFDFSSVSVRVSIFPDDACALITPSHMHPLARHALMSAPLSSVVLSCLDSLRLHFSEKKNGSTHA